jgi:hypothetical protein
MLLNNIICNYYIIFCYCIRFYVKKLGLIQNSILHVKFDTLEGWEVGPILLINDIVAPDIPN